MLLQRALCHWSRLAGSLIGSNLQHSLSPVSVADSSEDGCTGLDLDDSGPSLYTHHLQQMQK